MQGRDLAAQLGKASPDVIFNALHGQWGEDGRVQGVLDLYGKPYTHSGVMASALAMDKHRAKIICRAAGIMYPMVNLFRGDAAAKSHALKPPYVVKPNCEGSECWGYILCKKALIARRLILP